MTYKPGTRPSAPLGECGHPTRRAARICRSCHLAAQRNVDRACECGAILSTPKATQCRACYMRDHMAETSRPTCRDCGKLISWQVGHKQNRAKRCMPCHAAYRKTLPKRLCSLDGCEQKHWSGGFCNKHHPSAGDSRGIRNYLIKLPCAVCGVVDPEVIQIDRVIREKGYTWGNVVQVCANCHMKITRGTIERPKPWNGPPV